MKETTPLIIFGIVTICLIGLAISGKIPAGIAFLAILFGAGLGRMLSLNMR